MSFILSKKDFTGIVLATVGALNTDWALSHGTGALNVHRASLTDLRLNRRGEISDVPFELRYKAGTAKPWGAG